LIYNFLKILAKLSIPFYFSSVEINGKENIPKECRPIILAPNHQNAFLDAIVIAVFYDQPIYFLARASVFKGIFNKFLRAINMRPVFRMRDGYENLSKNHEVFDECAQLLKDNKSLLVFPEADHGEEYYLRKLSRGVPRIVHQAVVHDNLDVDIIPIGINYTHHFFSGGKLFLNFGPPLKVNDGFSSDLKEGAILNDIRSHIAREVKNLMLLPDKDEKYEEAKSFIMKEGRKYDFGSLQQILLFNKLESSSPRLLVKVITRFMTIPNLPFYTLIWVILKTKVPDPIFHASIKFAAIMLVAWLWFVGLFCVVFIWKGILLALLVLGTCITSAYFRTKCVSSTRFYS